MRRSTNAGTPAATEVASSCARELATPAGHTEMCSLANAGSGGWCTTERRSESGLQEPAGSREAVSESDDAVYDSPTREATYDIGGDDGDRDDTDMQQLPSQTRAEGAEPAESEGKEAVSKRRPVRDGDRNQRLRKALRQSLAGQLYAFAWLMTRIVCRSVLA